MSSYAHRSMLLLALVLSAGVLLNVFGAGGLRKPAGQAVATKIEVKPAAVAAERAATDRRAELLRGVRRELVVRGYLSRPGSGSVDDRTRAAIFAFQYDHHLALTAAPSEEVLKSLLFVHAPSSEAAASEKMAGPARDIADRVARALRRLGYLDSGAGLPTDAQLRRAILAFERARGLQQSGRISAVLIDGLGPALPGTRPVGTGKPTRTASAK